MTTDIQHIICTGIGMIVKRTQTPRWPPPPYYSTGQ